LRESLNNITVEINSIVDTANARDGKMLASEERKYQSLLDERSKLVARMEQLEDADQRRRAGAEAAWRLGQRVDQHGQPTSSGFARGADVVYGRGSGTSYFRDLLASATPGDPRSFEALQRLQEHAQMVERAESDLPTEFRADRGKIAAGRELRVNPDRTDGQGGYFVPPLWIMDEWVAALRAGRAVADRLYTQPLPPGTDLIQLPKVGTGTATEVQTADAQGVQSTDLTDEVVSGPVRTIAGQQDIAQQLLDQSPANFDEVVFQDLIADYNRKLDLQVIAGTGLNGQMKGLLAVSGINSVTYTDATPTLPELWPALTQAASGVNKGRFLPPDTVAMHPSLWWWMASQLDTTNRPLMAPVAGNGLNSVAVYDATGAEGVVGSVGGLPVVVDANIPTNLGAGTNETRVLVGRLKDFHVYEGALRTRALVEVLSGTLQVRLQVFNYCATVVDRYPTALSVISGTGLIPASGW
jgi:HK97 family phage major capsid protein